MLTELALSHVMSIANQIYLVYEIFLCKLSPWLVKFDWLMLTSLPNLFTGKTIPKNKIFFIYMYEILKSQTYSQLK